ncbi:MAG: methyltransferase domain-containing protein [Qipengyuania vulgaris]
MGTSRPVEWRCADALNLPFADNSFDVVEPAAGAGLRDASKFLRCVLFCAAALTLCKHLVSHSD